MAKDIYFRVGDKIFYSDIAARLHGKRSGQSVTFHAFDDVYDRVDWTKEPVDTWDQFCRERALSLRQRYSKLCLCFSAGSDSSDILRIFLENQIPLDELIIFRHRDHPYRCWEGDAMIIPMANFYAQQQPGLTVRVVDITREIHEQRYKNADWIENPHSMTGQMGFGAYTNSWLIREFCGANDQDNTGYLVGLEKPKLIIRDGWWTSSILDRNFDYWDLNDTNVTYFYLSPDWPEFYVKQCWEFIKYVEKTFSHIDMDLINQIYAHGSDLSHHLLLASQRRIYMDIKSPISLRNGSNKLRDLYDDKYQLLVDRARKEQWLCYNPWSEVLSHFQSHHAELFRDGDVHRGLIGVFSKSQRIKPVESSVSISQ